MLGLQMKRQSWIQITKQAIQNFLRIKIDNYVDTGDIVVQQDPLHRYRVQ